MGNAFNGKTSLTADEFDELCRTTSFTCGEIEDWHRKFKKSFPRGNIRKYQFKCVYHELFPKGDADEFCEHIFRIYDIDGNGVITFSEFLTTLHIAANGTAEQKLLSLFRLYDVNGDKKVTRSELLTIFEIMYKAARWKIDDARAEAQTNADMIMSALDTNNDNYLSEDEFIKAAQISPSLLEVLSGKV